MGAFEDFVNENLGKRLPMLEDNGHPHSSSKAAGIIGSRYLDLDTNYLYEKTGESNTQDWVKIATIGDARDIARGPNFSIQFNSGDLLGGSEYLIFSGNELSGVSGSFDNLRISGQDVLTGIDAVRTTAGGPDYAIQYGSGTGFYGSSNLIYSGEQLSGASGFFDDFKVTGDLAVGGNLYVSGETFIQSVTDVSVTGDISGHRIEGTSGVFDVTTGASGVFADQLTISGVSVLTGIETGHFVTTGQTGDFVTSGETGIFVTTGQTGDFVTTGFSGLVKITSGQFTEQLTISGNPVLTGAVGARPEGPDFAVQFGSGDTLSGNQYLLYSGNQLSGASGFFDDFLVSGVSQVTSGQFTEQLTISGNPVLTGFEDVTATPGGPELSIQFNSGNEFHGTSGLIYQSGQLSGVSGIFQEDLQVGLDEESPVLLVAEDDAVDIFGNLLVSGISSGISGVFDNIVINGWNPVVTGQFAESDSFTDIEYNSSGDITGSLNWTDNGRSTLIKIKQFNYNESGLLTGVISKDGTYTEQLTKILTYDSSGNLESIQKDYI